ncbi:MAG: type II secretion system minor pseudopilin GspI [Litorimonas sp.]
MKQAGFTLVEVLAALLIFSVAIIGLSRTGTQSVSHTQRLTHKTFASVVADNQLIFARMRRPIVGTTSGREEAGGQAYTWQLETLETPQEGLLELRVSVSQDDNVYVTRRAWLSEGS